MDVKQWGGLVFMGAIAMVASFWFNEKKDLSQVEGARVPSIVMSDASEPASRVAAPETKASVSRAAPAPVTAKEETAPQVERAATKDSEKQARPAPEAPKSTEGEPKSSAPDKEVAAKATPPASSPPRKPGEKAPSIKGVVKWEGNPPKNAKIDMSSDKVCKELCGEEDKRKETVVINENQTLRYVTVYVSEGLPKQQWPVREDTVVLDQVGCTYVPHVFAIQLGQNFEIKNSDPTSHNVHFKSKFNGDWNMSQPQPTTEAPKEPLKRPEVGARFNCDMHTWMEARCSIFDHPFFAVTGEDGSFEISGLPPGTYTVSAWHEKEKEQSQKVTVAADETTEVTFTFKRK